MNAVKNACFEFGTLESWKQTGTAKAELVKGNGWGNGWGSGKPHKTGTSRFELKLGPGLDGVSQLVTGLSPNRTYTLSAWARVSDKGESVTLVASDFGGAKVESSTSSTEWVRLSVEFTTGRQARSAVIHLDKTSAGNGNAWGDNFVLPLAPK
jgi:hypothetical protein